MASPNVELVLSHVDRREGVEVMDVVDGGERIALRVRIGGAAEPERIVGAVHVVRHGEVVDHRLFEQTAAALEALGVEGLRRDRCPFQLLRDSYDAFSRKDVESFLALQHEDVELIPLRAAVEGTISRGHDELRQMLAELMGDWDEQRLVPEEMYARAGGLVVAVAMTARGPASGALVQQRIGQAMWFREGKGYRIRIFPSLEEALAATAQD
jgi:ketosteroid isomerase-like protein